MSRWRIPMIVVASLGLTLTASAQAPQKLLDPKPDAAKAQPFVRYAEARDEVATPKCTPFEIRQLSVTVPENGVLVVQGHISLSGRGLPGGARCSGGGNWPVLPGLSSRADIKAGRFRLSLEQTAPGPVTVLSRDAVELDADIFAGSPRMSVSAIIPVTRGQTVQLSMKGDNSTLLNLAERSLSAMFFPGDPSNQLTQPNQPALSAPVTTEDPMCDAVCVGRFGGVPNGWALPAPMDGLLKYVDASQGQCEQKRGQNETGTGLCKSNTVCKNGVARIQEGGVWKCPKR